MKKMTPAQKAFELIKQGAPHSAITAAMLEVPQPDSVEHHRLARPLTLTARCIMGHRQVLADAQIEEARSLGAVICSKCQNVMIVESAVFDSTTT